MSSEFLHPINVQEIQDSVELNQANRHWFPFKPILLDVQGAHQQGTVHYDEGGTAILLDPTQPGLTKEIQVPLSHQFSPIHSIYLDVLGRLSGLENSPLLPSGDTLQSFVMSEFMLYQEVLNHKSEDGYPNISWGNYLYDPLLNCLFHIPPKDIFTYSLHTSHTLFEDPQNRPVSEIWQLLQDTLVVIAGASVGGNVAEGAFRAGTKLRIAERDHAEANTLLRQNRASLLDLVYSRAVNQNPFDENEFHRPNKASMLARALLLLNPFQDIEVFLEGITDDNLTEFLTADSKIIAFEETDDLRIKIKFLKACRNHNILRAMLSDVGDWVGAEIRDFRIPNLSLAKNVTDNELNAMLKRAEQGEDVVWTPGGLAEMLFGAHLISGSFSRWAKGEGEHATTSIPQPGDTALGAGYTAAKLIKRIVLGHDLPPRLTLSLT